MSNVTKEDVRPGDILRLQWGGELVLAQAAAVCGDEVRTVTAFSPGLVCICDMRWVGDRLASGRGVEFDVGRLPRRIGQ